MRFLAWIHPPASIFFCLQNDAQKDSTWSISACRLAASSSVSSLILGSFSASFLFFSSSSTLSLAALSAFSFFSLDSFSLWALSASWLWWANASFTSYRKEKDHMQRSLWDCTFTYSFFKFNFKSRHLTFSGAPGSPPIKKSVFRRRKLKNVLTSWKGDYK